MVSISVFYTVSKRCFTLTCSGSKNKLQKNLNIAESEPLARVNLIWKSTISPLFFLKTKLKEQLLSAQSEHKAIRSAACRADRLTMNSHNAPLCSINNCKQTHTEGC